MQANVHRPISSIVLLMLLVALPSAAQFGPQGPAVNIEALLDTDVAHAGDVARIAVVVKLGVGWHVNAHQPADPTLIPTVLQLKPTDKAVVENTVYPEPTQLTLQGTPEPLSVYAEQFTVGIETRVAQNVQPGTYTLEGTLQYQACDNKQCFPPKTIPVRIPIVVGAADQARKPQHQDVFEKIKFGKPAEPTPAPAAPSVNEPARPRAAVPEGDWQALAGGFTVQGSASGYLGARDFLAFLDSVESGQGGATTNPLADKAVWFVFAFVVGGGLLLNLTPCVLPLIPINLGIIGAGAKAGSRSRGFLLGGTYGAGIALTYGILGLIVVLGVSKTFGAINATPWFNGAIALIFVALGLAMFDVFLLDFTKFQTKVGVKRKEGGSLLVALLMGSISALLAGACVAPVIISTLVYAQDQYAKGMTVALFLPFLLGLGMALPWPFAGAGLSFLPKPGKWMERVKYAFGVLIFLFAAYYAHLAHSLFSDRYLVDKEAVKAAAAQMDKEGWISSLSQGLAQAQREHKPVFVDFWATWCKNCLTMNQTTFKDPAVMQRLDRYVKIKYQAENPSDPATQAVMQHFNVVGLPTYVALATK